MAKHGTVTKPRRPEKGYFATMARAAWSILEGMAVTFSYFLADITKVFRLNPFA